MTTPEHVPSAQHAELPSAQVHRGRWAGSAVWLLPLAAVVLTSFLGYRYFTERGPLITISFSTAAGLAEKQTEVRYKSVTLGTVERVALSQDLSHVIAHVRMSAKAERLLTDQARFWVVRPRLGGGLSAVRTGLETLVSGAYVAIDPGSGGGKPLLHFEGLDEPPNIRSDEPGTVYFLAADSPGGVEPGAPVFYKDITVGEVLGHEVRSDAPVKIRIFVEAPYDRRVVEGTRFWNASGIRVESTARGLQIKLESARAVLSGAIAFASPEIDEQPPSRPETTFRLYPNEAEAQAGVATHGAKYVSYFRQSVEGLAPGSEVTLLGQRVGTVTGVGLARDPSSHTPGDIAARVRFVIQSDDTVGTGNPLSLTQNDLRALTKQNLRVVLRGRNLLTNEKTLSLEYVPDSSTSGSDELTLSKEGEALVLPSEVQSLEQASRAVERVAEKLDQIPFARIGASLAGFLGSLERSVRGPELRSAVVSLDATLSELEKLARQANRDAGAALARLPHIARELESASRQANAALSDYGSDSVVHRNLARTLGEIADAARSLRLLADYLNRHPEALVRGRTEGDP